MDVKVKSIKPATSYLEQLELLKWRGLSVADEDKAIAFLSTYNYYSITGYLHNFKIGDEKYIEGISFDRIQNIMEFDRRLRGILMYAIETVEHSLKTKIAYCFAHNFDSISYAKSDLDCKIFKNSAKHNLFLKHLNKAFENNNNLPFIKHHNKEYGNQIPIWVGVEIFTMGMAYHFLANLQTSIQKEIAREFGIGVNHLLSWVEYITYVRNLCAHHMRLYNSGLQKDPVKLKSDPEFQAVKKIFDVLLVLKHLIQDKAEWNDYIVTNIRALIRNYADYIEIDAIGFPENWWEKVYVTDSK